MNSLEKSQEIVERRVKEIQKTLDKNEAYLFDNPFDLFYLTHKTMSLGTLLVLKDSVYLLVDGRYISACKSLLHVTTLLSEKHKESDLLKKHAIQTLYFDGSKTTFDRYENLKKQASGYYTLSQRTSLLKSQRRVKNKEEITIMKENAIDLYSSYEALFSEIREGISEQELATIFKITALAKGATDFSFEPIIAFGENSAFIHHRPTERKLKKGDVILIDIGLEKNRYQSDMTRVVFFGGATQELMQLHDVVLAAHDAALALCKPGSTFKDLDLAARKVMKENHLESYFMHGLGHGIGLETHESPRIKFDSPDAELFLEPGMVFTIEPGLYLEGKGGIRYEDTIVITNDGYENFFPGKKVQHL